MQKSIDEFIQYLGEVRMMSQNTISSYRRDLNKLCKFMREKGILEVAQVNEKSLQEYILFLEENKFANATISRHIATVKSWFLFLMKEEMVETDISKHLKAPKIEKKIPEILNMDEVEKLLEEPKGNKPKELRDKAMLELLYATGIRVSELITLSVSQLNMQMNYIVCNDGYKNRIIPF